MHAFATTCLFPNGNESVECPKAAAEWVLLKIAGSLQWQAGQKLTLVDSQREWKSKCCGGIVLVVFLDAVGVWV